MASSVIICLLISLMTVGINAVVRKPDCLLKDYDTQYAGKFTKTYGGFKCQRWDSQTPHTHTLKASAFPEPTLAHAANYCRVVDGKMFPWCYTTVKQPPSERCKVPYCTVGAECRVTKKGGEYMGTLNKTKSGKTCQRWDSQTPNAHPFTTAGGENFAEDTLEEVNNYCRNYKGLDPEPWCYTIDITKPWDYCDPPMCQFNEICGPFPAIAHGTASRTPSATKKYSYEESVHYTCGTGYEFPDQYDGISCKLNGKWSTAPVCKAVKCPDPTIPNASFTTTNPANEYKTEVTYKCNYGYQMMSGDTKRVCQSDKTWSGAAPNCKRIDCGALPTEPEGTLVSKSSSYVDGIAEYKCDRSAETFFKVCKKDWKWYGTVCGALPSTTLCPTVAPCPPTAAPCDCQTDPAGASSAPDPNPATSSCVCPESTCSTPCNGDTADIMGSTPFIAGAAAAGLATFSVITGLSIAICKLRKTGIPSGKVGPM